MVDFSLLAYRKIFLFNSCVKVVVVNDIEMMFSTTDVDFLVQNAECRVQSCGKCYFIDFELSITFSGRAMHAPTTVK